MQIFNRAAQYGRLRTDGSCFYKYTMQAPPILSKGEGKTEVLSGDKMNVNEVIALSYSESAWVC